MESPGIEPGLAAAMLALGLVGQANVPTSWYAWVLDATLFLGGALCGAFPRASTAVLLCALIAKLVVPPDEASLIPLITLVAVLSIVGRRVRYGFLFCSALSGAMYLLLAVHVEGFPPTASTSAVLAVFVGLAAIGGVLWRNAAERLALQRIQAKREMLDLRLELARDLHDTVAQSLAHIAMQAWMLADEPDIPRGARQTIEGMGRDASASATDLRQLLSTLREDLPAPSTVGPLADADTLREQVEEQAERLRTAGLVPEVNLNLTTVSAARSTALAKTVVEAANNMIKHAPPGSRCLLSLVETSNLVVGTFANPVAPGRRTGKGLGLVGMEERLHLLQGTLETTVEEGRWTTTITLPRI
ncbi:hypothetical protein EII42_03515 [Tessaracoccus sp. OH4464_COT-324]|nr:hypothetical protein EII42_03515 [Tessaracoccus sp. OH4464_COT-324]